MPKKVVADIRNTLGVKTYNPYLKTRAKRSKHKVSEQKDTEQQHICKTCNKAFRRKDSLYVHERLHTGERPFVCKECSKGFRSLDTLKSHLTVHSDRAFSCDQCDKTFKRKDRLYVHERLHSGDQPFVCKQCSKGFRSQDSLRSHLAVHSDEKAFSCNKCNKTFKTSHQMRKHQRLAKIAMSKNEPNDHKPVKCKLCNFLMTSKQERKQHMRFHKKKDNPYLCSKCKKSFSSLKQLGEHYKSSCNGTRSSSIRKKEGKRKKIRKQEPPLAPFACHRCSKRFKTISNLGLHFISHTESDHFKCSSCKTDFQSVLEYQEHQCVHEQSVRVKPKLVVKFQTCVLDPGLAEGDEEQESREEVVAEGEAPIEHLTGFNQGGVITEHIADKLQNVPEAQSSEVQEAGH